MTTADLLQPATSVDFWKSLCPSLHIEDASYVQANQGTMAVDEATAAGLRQLVLTEGYFQLPPQQWGLPLPAMAQAIASINAQGLPPPFCFVYDEFWLYFHRLNHLIAAVLGAGFLRLPDFWAWLVDPAKGESGWAPHRDKGYQALYPDGSPKSLTVWLPLTDATPLNGCMYLLPAHLDPTYGKENDKEYSYRPADVRALPAEAGSVLAWNQAVLHWGSRTSRRGAHPRISVAFEFQRADVPPFNQPLTRPDEVPGFEFRVRLIAKQILQYRHMYPLAPALERLALSLEPLA